MDILDQIIFKASQMKLGETFVWEDTYHVPYDPPNDILELTYQRTDSDGLRILHVNHYTPWDVLGKGIIKFDPVKLVFQKNDLIKELNEHRQFYSSADYFKTAE